MSMEWVDAFIEAGLPQQIALFDLFPDLIRMAPEDGKVWFTAESAAPTGFWRDKWIAFESEGKMFIAPQIMERLVVNAPRA